MMPVSIFIISYFSEKLKLILLLKNKLPPEKYINCSQPNTEALLPSLLFIVSF